MTEHVTNEQALAWKALAEAAEAVRTPKFYDPLFRFNNISRTVVPVLVEALLEARAELSLFRRLFCNVHQPDGDEPEGCVACRLVGENDQNLGAMKQIAELEAKQ